MGFSYFRAVSELLTYDESQAQDIEKVGIFALLKASFSSFLCARLMRSGHRWWKTLRIWSLRKGRGRSRTMSAFTTWGFCESLWTPPPPSSALIPVNVDIWGFLFSLYSVEDKQMVANLTHIPKFLPEITIGAHDYDEKYYAYRSVRKHVLFCVWADWWLPWRVRVRWPSQAADAPCLITVALSWAAVDC